MLTISYEFKLFGVDFGLKLNETGEEIRLDFALSSKTGNISYFGILWIQIQSSILRLTQFLWLDILGVKRNILIIGILQTSITTKRC